MRETLFSCLLLFMTSLLVILLQIAAMAYIDGQYQTAQNTRIMSTLLEQQRPLVAVTGDHSNIVATRKDILVEGANK